MPKAPTRDTLIRQWTLLQLIPPSGPGRTAKELTEQLISARFKVGKRTVERDLGLLMEVFGLACNNASIPYGWHWIPGTATALPGISLSEAVSLGVVQKTLKVLLPRSVLRALEPRFQQAEKRLELHVQEHQTAQLKDKIRSVSQTLHRIPPATKNSVEEAVHEALLTDRQIDARYRSMGRKVDAPVRLHPLGLIQRGPLTYLVATDDKLGEERLYALHRFASARRTEAEAKRPRGFDLDKYIATHAPLFGGGKTTRFTAWVTDDLARRLEEAPLSTKQRLTRKKAKSDRLFLEASVPDSWQLRWWVLSQGISIEVLSPTSLRKSVAEILSDAAAQYSK